MADDPEKNPQEPNLELPPLLGFGRKKRARKAGRGSAEQVSPSAGQGAAGEPGAMSDTEATATQGDDPLSADPVPEPRAGLAPATGATKRLPPVPPPAEHSAEETTVLPAVGRDEHIDDSSDAAAPVAAPHHHDTMTAAHAGPDFTVADAEPVGRKESTPAEDSTSPGRPRKPRRPRKSPSLKLPVISPLIAAVVTGLLVGLLTVVLSNLANRGCETVRGVGSCGGLGLLLLLAVVAVDIVVGAALLKAWRLADPTSTAFLGVGLMAVFVLLFLLDALESIWMLLVIPLVGAAGFLISWWVTTSIVEDHHDVHR